MGVHIGVDIHVCVDIEVYVDVRISVRYVEVKGVAAAAGNSISETAPQRAGRLPNLAVARPTSTTSALPSSAAIRALSGNCIAGSVACCKAGE